MRFRIAFLSLVSCLLLAGCKPQPKLVPIGGASDNNPSAVALIREGSMFVRGLDRKRFDFKEIQNPFGDFLYAVTPGRHEFLAINVQSGHLVPIENMRCYTLEADVQAGVVYRLVEDREKWRASLVREKDGQEIAVGKMIDRQSSFGKPCDWG